MNNLLLLIGMVLLLGCSQRSEHRHGRKAVLPFYGESSFTPVWLDPESDSLSAFHRIPPFTLIDQNNDTVTEASVAGKIYVADFFFTSCPGICPKMTRNMKMLQDTFQNDERVVLLSHSVTPNKDSVPVLQQYALEHGVNASKWHLLTGSREVIYALGRKAYFVEEDQGLTKSDSDFLHTENFVLVDGDRHIRGIYNGLNKASVQQLIHDIKALETE